MVDSQSTRRLYAPLKNTILAKFFVNIGRADELGSGVRNLYKYTKIYTGGAEPELTEGNVFKIIVPLESADKNKVQSNTDLKSNHCALNCTLNCTLIKTQLLEFIKLNPTATQKAMGCEKITLYKYLLLCYAMN